MFFFWCELAKLNSLNDGRVAGSMKRRKEKKIHVRRPLQPFSIQRFAAHNLLVISGKGSFYIFKCDTCYKLILLRVKKHCRVSISFLCEQTFVHSADNESCECYSLFLLIPTGYFGQTVWKKNCIYNRRNSLDKTGKGNDQCFMVRVFFM